MSTADTMGAGTAAGGLPPERRGLVAGLAITEGVLLLAASLLTYFFAPQPVPVYGVAGSGGSSTSICYPPVMPGGTTVPSSSPCPPTYSNQAELLAAAVCSVLALLVLPAVIGFVSRRWQSALAVPALPLWVALLVMVGVSLALQAGSYQGFGGTGLSGALAAWTQVLSVSGAVFSGLLMATAFGGMGWLAQRAFAR